MLGQKPPAATQVNPVSSEDKTKKPYFDLMPETKKDSSKTHFPERSVIARADNDNFLALKAA